MKKYLILLSSFLIAGLLGGCVSISLTDGGKLEISPDGIQVIQDDEEVDKEVEEEVELDTDEKEQEPIEPGKDGLVEGINVDEDEEFLIDEGFGGCNNEFYLLQNRILDGFPLTPCPEFKTIEIKVDENQRDVYANYQVFVGIYDKFELYKDYFVGKGYTFESERIRGQWGQLEVKDDQMKMAVEVSMVEDDNFDTAMVEMSYTESPAREHKVVDSIINWNEKTGYGNCADEHYVLTGTMSKEFPFDSCMDLSFLRIDFGETETNVQATFLIEGVFQDIQEGYRNYIGDKEYSLGLSEQEDGRVRVELEYVGDSD